MSEMAIFTKYRMVPSFLVFENYSPRRFLSHEAPSTKQKIYGPPNTSDD